MSAHHSLRSRSPLKTVFGKLGDTYQAYCNTYKTHAMATHHGGLGQPLDTDIDITIEAHKNTHTDIENTQDFYVNVGFSSCFSICYLIFFSLTGLFLLERQAFNRFSCLHQVLYLMKTGEPVESLSL